MVVGKTCTFGCETLTLMGCIGNDKIVIIGNFEKPRRYKHGRPKDWIDRDYKAIVEWDSQFKDWERPTLGKATCDCKEVLECYQPYYGFTWYHSDDCAIVKHLEKYPQIYNLVWWYDPKVIAMA